MAAGHSVVGITRSPGKRARIAALGASVVVADALDEAQILKVTEDARPDVIVHELTHILTDEWARSVEQVIHDMVPRRLQREARTSIRPHEESVVEAIAHALVRTAEQATSKAAPKS